MEPFTFLTSMEAVRLTSLKAVSLAELDEGIRQVDGSSIYHHTHRFYRSYSFLGPLDRSDFALWVGNNLREEAVAERLGALDLRDYRTVESLRTALLETLRNLRGSPARLGREGPAGLAFPFCSPPRLVPSTVYRAANLEEFQRALERVDVSCVYFHLIEAPLHYYAEGERAYANDFSQWLLEAGFPKEAQAVAELDPYQGDLDAVRERLLAIFAGGRLKAAGRTIACRLRRDPGAQAASDWLKRWRKGG